MAHPHHPIPTVIITEAVATMAACGTTPLDCGCLGASAPEAAAVVESRSSSSSSGSGGDMAAVAAASRGGRHRLRSRLLQPPALLSLLLWVALGAVVGALLPRAAAAQADDDEGAPFPISTTSQGIGRRYVYVRERHDGQPGTKKMCRASGDPFRHSWSC